MDHQKLKFEDALKRLEALVGKMEKGDLLLDEAITSFEEGIGLAKFCEQKLNEAQGKVEKLLKATDGTAPFRVEEDKPDSEDDNSGE